MLNRKHILPIVFSFFIFFQSFSQDTDTRNSNYPKIIHLKRKFYFDSNPTIPVSSRAVLVYAENFSDEKNIIDLKQLVVKTKRNGNRQAAFGTGGVMTMGIGLAAFGLGLATYDRVNDPSEDLYKLAGFVFCIGASFEITSIVNGINKRKRIKKVVDLYNKHLPN